MKRNHRSRAGISTILCLALIITSFLNSCTKEAVSTEDLLSTVPSSAGFVVGLNTSAMLEKAGCKVDGSSVKPGEDVEAWLERSNGISDAGRKSARLLLTGESGLNPGAALLFSDAYSIYLTALVSDTGKFTDFVENMTGEKFADENGVQICANVAMKGAQAWMCVSSHNTIDSKTVDSFASLSRERSFLSNTYSSHIASMKSDIVGWADLKSVMRYGLTSGRLSSINLLTGMLFENATALSFSADFTKGKATATINVINDKGEPARYLLPVSRIDVPTVKTLGEKANVVAAASISKDLVKKIENMGASLGGQMFSLFIDALKPLDGTLAIASGSRSDLDSSLSAVITTDGSPSRDLMSMLSSFGQTSVEGKLVKVTNGTLEGALQIATAADAMKGAVMAIAVDMTSPGSGAAGVDYATIALVPDGIGLRCDISAAGSNPSENILLTLIKSDAAK